VSATFAWRSRSRLREGKGRCFERKTVERGFTRKVKKEGKRKRKEKKGKKKGNRLSIFRKAK
jgi:hypothetical protein